MTALEERLMRGTLYGIAYMIIFAFARAFAEWLGTPLSWGEQYALGVGLFGVAAYRTIGHGNHSF